MEKVKKRRKKKMSVADRCEMLLDESLDGAGDLIKIGRLSEKLGRLIEDALDDKDQFKRYIVTKKISGKDTSSECVEQVFEKVDFKSVKEAASAITALADSVRSVYSLPDFASLSGHAAGEGAPEAREGLTITFEDGEEMAR